MITYRSCKGHCLVSTNEPPLSEWVEHQRSQYALFTNGKPSSMTDARINALEAIGFAWSSLLGDNTTWMMRYEELKHFKAENGHTKVPKSYTPSPSLAQWVSTQRKEYKYTQQGKRSRMTEARRKALDQLGFDWVGKKTNDASWQKHFLAVKAFKKRMGHCNVPRNWVEDVTLANWVHSQRGQYRNLKEGRASTLTPERVSELEHIGFEFKIRKTSIGVSWETRYDQMKRFYKKEGHCLLSKSECKNDEDIALVEWAYRQKNEYRKMLKNQSCVMNEERKKLLDEIEFVWDNKNEEDEDWERCYEALLDFKKLRGHCDVPADYEEHPGLAQWVAEQRKEYYNKRRRNGVSKMTERQLMSLREIGFLWRVEQGNQEIWMEKYEELKEFISKHGHCSVPNKRKKNSNDSLFHWVVTQRRQYRRGKNGDCPPMNHKRVELLKEIGFEFDVSALYDEGWMKKFEMLHSFKVEQGHCNVPRGHRKYRHLASWVHSQRGMYKKMKEGKPSSMTEERAKKLEEIGFIWNVRYHEVWLKQYSKLKALAESGNKVENGDTDVCDQELVRWVQKQRQDYQLVKAGKASQLTREMVWLLEDIDFEWDDSVL